MYEQPVTETTIATSGSSSIRQVDRPSPAVQRAVGNIGATIENVAKLVDALRVRLDPVLNPHGESRVDDPEGPKPPRAPLADALEGHVHRMTLLHDELQTILQRLEV